jgi:hypothetical protein
MEIRARQPATLTLHVDRQWHGGGTALMRAVERIAIDADYGIPLRDELVLDKPLSDP